MGLVLLAVFLLVGLWKIAEPWRTTASGVSQQTQHALSQEPATPIRSSSLRTDGTINDIENPSPLRIVVFADVTVAH
jgi:hypothetical protein